MMQAWNRRPAPGLFRRSSPSTSRSYIVTTTSNTLYDRDFYEWTEVQAALLRGGHLSEADRENLADEIEAIGRSEKTEVRRRLARIIQHMLKWAYQPDLRSRSWSATPLVQRNDLEAVLADSPSLRGQIADMLPRSFALGRAWALEETGLLDLPSACEWSVEDILDVAFLPSR